MPPTRPNDSSSLPWSDPADGMIDYDALTHDLTVDVDSSHTGLYDLFQSNPEVDSKSKTKEVLQPGHALPSALSPTASDPDSASDSSRSTAAMNNIDVNDVAMNGYFEFGEDPGMDWADLTIFNNDEVHDTINPAVIGQPMGMQMDLVDISPGPDHDFSSPSDVNASPPAKYDPDDYLPMGSVSSSQDSPMHLHSPLSQSQGFARKRLSVRNRSSPYSSSSILIVKQQASSAKSINGLRSTNSRDVSPTSHVVFSQGSSPFASTEAAIPDRSRLSRGNPPGGSWFNQPIPSSTGQLPQQSTEPATPIATLLQHPPSGSPRPTLTLFGIPPKSRVETQIHLKMALHPVPEGIKKIRLPPYTIAKPKFRAKPNPLPQPDTLELFIQVVCTSAMEKSALRQRALARAAASKHPTDVEADPNETPETGGEVRICGSCITREYKRVNRKKNKKPGEDVEWRKDESKRVIIFNTQEIKEWQHPGQEYMLPIGAMLADTPMRITCYCRHHSEKTGYQVIFTLKNHLGQVVTQALSQSIMITDDHKTPQGPSAVDEVDSATAGLNGVNDMNAVQPGQPFRLSQSTSDIQALKRSASALMPQAVPSGSSTMRNSTVPTPRILSRPPSPTTAGPSAKKRKSSGSKIPSGLHMTRLETTNGFAPQPSNSLQNGQSASSSSATSPFSPPNSIPFSDGTGGVFGQNPAATAPLFPVGPQTPNSNDQSLFTQDPTRMTNADGRTMTPLYSAPPSAHTSRAPSPNGLRNGGLQQHQNLQQLSQLQHSQLNQIPQTLAHGLPLSAPFANAGQRRPPVQILKVVPPEGPMSGGIEVTVLGSGCCRDLDVFFGDTKATTTTFWGDSTLTCILPPYHQSGPVHVTVRGTNGQTQTLSRSPPIFIYKDETQDQLRDLAIDVLARKMMGKMANVKEFVTRIIGEHGMTDASVNGGGFSGSAPGYNLNLETKLLKVLDLMDMDDSLNKARLNMSRKGGLQTMLHLSCALGFYRFTAGLLARGAKPDVQDVCGYTPLHYAAMHNHPELVRRLIQHKADPTLRTTAGLLASDVATTRDVIRAIKRAGRRGSNMHSRASSATSLRSFWDPSKADTTETHDSTYDETSDESESSGDSSSDDDQHLWLGMGHRRVSRGHPARASRASLVDLPDPIEQGGLSPAMATFKDLFQQQFHQFQQFQQSMMQNLHLPTRQNLPNIPYLPQMSNMMASQDDQAWNAAQLMQRMSAYLPNIGSSSLPTPAEGLPPAYEDIFPRNRRIGKAVTTEFGDIDTKQASAAQAATEYEADRKCAALYDQTQQTELQQSLTHEIEVLQTPKQLPKLLQIGRKNNITKEQQDNLRQAHAENLKNLSRDRHLFFIWVSLCRNVPSTV